MSIEGKRSSIGRATLSPWLRLSSVGKNFSAHFPHFMRALRCIWRKRFKWARISEGVAENLGYRHYSEQPRWARTTSMSPTSGSRHLYTGAASRTL